MLPLNYFDEQFDSSQYLIDPIYEPFVNLEPVYTAFEKTHDEHDNLRHKYEH